MKKPIKVMIADDSLMMRTILKTELSFGDFKVIAEATNGQEAVKKFNQFQPDVLILDLFMPIMNGMNAAEQILKDNSKAKIIVISIIEDQDTIEKLIKLGVKRYFTKPIAPNELRDAVQMVALGGFIPKKN